MIKEKIVNFCDQAISYLILGLIFLLPLYFTTFTFLTFEVNKVVFFRLVVELLFLIFITKALVTGKLQIYSNRWFGWPVLLIFFSQLLSTFLSSHREIAWWGSYFRSDGLFTELHFYIFAWLFLQAYQRPGLTLKRLLYAISISALLVAGYGIMQVSGFDFFAWQQAGNYLARANSSLGQPNYLASFLLLALPIAFFLFKTENDFRLRLFWLSSLLIEFWALVLTYSRAGWLGLVAGLAAFGLIWLFKRHRSAFIFASCLLIVISSLYLYISFVKPVDILPDNSSLTFSYRLKSLLNPYQGSNILRLFYYQDAKQIIASAPWFGHGLDVQALYFYKYYQPQNALYEAIYTFPDRAHNQLLDILITTGLVGLACWGFLYVIIIGQSFKFLKFDRSSPDQLLAKCLLFAISACSVSLLFGFFNITVSVWFWLMVAWLLFTVDDDRATVNLTLKIRSWLAYVLTGSLWLFISYFSWQANFKLVIADYYYRQARIDQLKNNYDQMFADFNQVFKYAPAIALDNYYLTQSVVDTLPSLAQLAGAQDRKSLLLYLAENNQGRATADFGLFDKVFANILLSELGKNKLELGQTVPEIKEFKQADFGFGRLAKEAPGFALVFFHWGNLYYDQANYQQAIAKYNQALALYPDLTSQDLNMEHFDLIVRDKAMVLRMLATAEIAEKKYSLALVTNQTARRLLPTDQGLNQQAAVIYYALGRPELAEAILEHQVFIASAVADNYYQLAILERALGKVSQAEANIKWAIKLKALTSYQSFLAGLSNKNSNSGDYLNLGFIK